MTYRSRLLTALLAALAAGCPTTTEEPKKTPYPALTVTGTVLDVRGDAPILGVHVVVWNEFDTGSANTAADGTFTLTVDGSDSASYISITHASYRPTATTTITVTAASHTAGTRRIMSKDEVLFSTFSPSNIYMVRVGGDGTLVPIAETADSEISPCRSESGLTVRWANATTGRVMEGGWNGSGAAAVGSAFTEAILGISWSPRATFVSTNDAGTDAVVMAGEPSGVGTNFTYDWAGTQPDASPAAFGYFGPQAIEGNMLAFVKGDGIYTAFPYFTNSFLVPERILTTETLDNFPSWSPHRVDGTLDLAFNRGYDVYTTRVSASGHANSWSTAGRIYGGVTGDSNITDIAWAPEAIGADDRLVFVVNPFGAGAGSAFGAGDLIVLNWNHSTGATSGPTLLYDASGVGNVGAAANVNWR
jgi:hypothetical protein